MTDNVYSISEIVGTSDESIDEAIRGAISRASKTLHHLDWFEVTGITGTSRTTGWPTSRSR